MEMRIVLSRDEMKELIENTIIENVFIDNTVMSFDMVKIMKGVRE
jgi:hypothetical protein